MSIVEKIKTKLAGIYYNFYLILLSVIIFMFSISYGLINYLTGCSIGKSYETILMILTLLSMIYLLRVIDECL